MNIEQFEDLVDRCGELPAEWPEAVRVDALKFLDGSPEAREVIAEAAALRIALGGSVAEQAPANFADRIVTLAGRVDDLQPFKSDLRPGPTPMPRRHPLLSRIGLPKLFLWLGVFVVASLASVWSMVGR